MRWWSSKLKLPEYEQEGTKESEIAKKEAHERMRSTLEKQPEVERVVIRSKRLHDRDCFGLQAEKAFRRTWEIN